MIASAASAVSWASTEPGGYHSSRPSAWRASRLCRITTSAGTACTSTNRPVPITPASRPQTRIAPPTAIAEATSPRLSPTNNNGSWTKYAASTMPGNPLESDRNSVLLISPARTASPMI